MTAPLNTEEDAYGHEIQDYHSTGEGYEIIERDDGYFDISSGPRTYFLSVNDWPECEKEAVGEARGVVLDVGVGAGRVSLYLQERGLKCVGIDNSPLAVATAALRGASDARVLPFDCDMSLNETFDTVIMFGNNFGLFNNRDNAGVMLKLLHAMTSDDALILAESIDPYLTGRREHRDYHAMNRKRGRMGGQVRIRVRYRRYATPWFDYLLVSKEEMKEIVQGTGWKVTGFHSGSGPLYVARLEKA